jgi:hypothetical protein
MAKGKKTAQTEAAELSLKVREAFKKGTPRPPAEVSRAVGKIARHGTIVEALLTLMSLPVEEPYGLPRMALLERVLELSKQQLSQPWYQQRISALVLLPVEYEVFERFCAQNNIELTDKHKVLA